MPLRLFWFEMEVSIIWRYKYTTSQRRCQVFRCLFYKSSSNKSDTTESEEVFLYWWYLSTNSLVLVTIFTADYHRITRCQFFVYKKLGVCRQGVNFLLTKNWHLVDRRRKRFSILLQKDEKKKIIRFLPLRFIVRNDTLIPATPYAPICISHHWYKRRLSLV